MQIKLRVPIFKDGKFDHFIIHSLEVCLRSYSFGNCHFLGDYEVKPPQLFTGVKDRNGKEIFEGDILNCYNDAAKDDSWSLDKEHIGVIEYCDNCFCLKSNGVYLTSWISAENIEVLGNIYQTPQLIQQ